MLKALLLFLFGVPLLIAGFLFVGRMLNGDPKR